jgi:menaquinol-cytochrome c reductase cytochrome b/c subunit
LAHGPNNDEKIVYVGDSRVRANRQAMEPKDYSAYPGKSEAFVPNFLLKEWMVAAVFLVGVLTLVMSEPAPLGYPADPTTAGFIPMPDWYFLFLYQLLKYPYTSGNYKIFGTLLIPMIMFGALIVAPFLDSGKERRFYRRPVTSTLMFLSLIATIYLTVFSWHHYTKELEDKGIVPEHIKREEEAHAAKSSGQQAPKKDAKSAAAPIQAKEDPGAAVFAKATCLSCHGADLTGAKAANIPALRGIGDTYDKAAILDIIKKGKGNMTAQYNDNKAKGLTDQEIDQLANWLAMQKKAQ